MCRRGCGARNVPRDVDDRGPRSVTCPRLTGEVGRRIVTSTTQPGAAVAASNGRDLVGIANVAAHSQHRNAELAQAGLALVEVLGLATGNDDRRT